MLTYLLYMLEPCAKEIQTEILCKVRQPTKINQIFKRLFSCYILLKDSGRIWRHQAFGIIQGQDTGATAELIQACFLLLEEGDCSES
ncbi:hypothetical protein JRQ81_000849 [Phrynocephalus forsythii]|uniref:Uncharacterized protein n=1 Tax=Phrynocephalus forsythii TaxID=171643 RepID=A0A9Q0Y623_9SAUR|nr:hypothetical protein JRQ81_000849 [Phrynocephalus forsythii]